MPKTPAYEPGKEIGRTCCKGLAETAQVRSSQEMSVGIFLLALVRR